MSTALPYLRYDPSVEIITPDEHVTFDELSRLTQHITRHMATHYRHAYRPVHAKSHGVLVGQLEVLPNLPVPLAQGLFAQPGTHSVVMRFSTNPGDLLADNISTPRGVAVKVLNVDGPKVANYAGKTSQDFVCLNTNVFGAANAKDFLDKIQIFDKTLDTSEGLKHAVSLAARATNAALKAVHLPSVTLENIAAASTHILGESFTTVVPLRYGDYVAKIGFAPSSENLKELTGKSVDLDDYNALEELIKKFFRHETAVWDVKVQLALEPTSPGMEESDKNFPIEAPNKAWPEDLSPWQTVGRITAVPQDTYSDARQLYVDEKLSFSPWHALEAHRPLGQIMRSRLKAYEEAAKYRAQRNERPREEPTSADEIPA